MNSIREYLCREAARITDAAGRRFGSKEELLASRGRLRAEYLEMMGIVDLPPKDERPPLNVTVTAKTEKEAYVIERLYYESLPRLYVTANLYVPKGTDSPAPAVAYFCGHSATQKFHYQTHARAWAELGFVTIVVDTIQFGEIKGHHHGCYSQGWFNWYSRGYTPGGVEVLNGIRALDLLESREEVDSERIGVTGISGGGAMSWWLGAADERAKAIAPVCGTGTVRSHIAERTLDGHCDCMFFVNYYGWDLADLACLTAPRPLLICSADHDGIYSIESIRECYERAKVPYDLLGAADNVRLIETPGQHSYHETSRKGIFSWFFRHLCGREVAPEDIQDVDPYEVNDWDAEELRVYVEGPPRDERTSVIHDSFVPLAPKPEINSPEELKKERERVVKCLRTRSFRHFPEEPCDLDYREEFEYQSGDALVRRFSFVPEEGWRLHGRLVIPEEARGRPSPALVYAENPRGGRRQADEFWAGLDPSWIRITFQPRGVGETSWGEDLAWHVRRACAVTGRTVASMRTYDVLRALELARNLPECNGLVAAAGREESAVAVLYAALVSVTNQDNDGGVQAVILGQPPPTQDAPSSADGTGAVYHPSPANQGYLRKNEMLGVLRFTDLPVAAGLLYPAELVFLGNRPGGYVWTEELYSRLAATTPRTGRAGRAPGRVVHVKTLADWRPPERPDRSGGFRPTGHLPGPA